MKGSLSSAKLTSGHSDSKTTLTQSMQPRSNNDYDDSGAPTADMTRNKASNSTSKSLSFLHPSAESKPLDQPDGMLSPQEKVIISGDDILIEYCERTVRALKQIPDAKLRPAQHAQLLRFITYYVWHAPDKQDFSDKTLAACTFWGRVKNRIAEMRERRRRLLKLQLKKEGLGRDSESAYQTLIAKKTQVLARFDS